MDALGQRQSAAIVLDDADQAAPAARPRPPAASKAATAAGQQGQRTCIDLLDSDEEGQAPASKKPRTAATTATTHTAAAPHPGKELGSAALAATAPSVAASPAAASSAAPPTVTETVTLLRELETCQRERAQSEHRLGGVLARLEASERALAESEAARESEATESRATAASLRDQLGEAKALSAKALDPEAEEAERPCFGRYLLVWEEHLVLLRKELTTRWKSELSRWKISGILRGEEPRFWSSAYHSCAKGSTTQRSLRTRILSTMEISFEGARPTTPSNQSARAVCGLPFICVRCLC